MFSGILLIGTAVWMGFAISFVHLHPFLSLIECLAAASPIGLTLCTWIGVILKSFIYASAQGLTPGLGFSVSLVQIFIASIYTYFILQNWDSRTSKFFFQTVSYTRMGLLLVVLPISLWFVYIHYTHSLLRVDDKYYVGGTVYGDMPFHMMIISSLLFGVNMHAAPLAGAPLQSAFYADSELIYPYIPDYNAALIAGSGSTLHFSLFVPGSLLCASFVLLLYFLSLRLTNNATAAALSVPIALLAGGTGAFWWLMFDGSYYGLRSVNHVLEDAITRRVSMAWFSLPAHILLPQRTTQFAYSVGLLALLIIYKCCQLFIAQQKASAVVSSSSGTPITPRSPGTPTMNRLKTSSSGSISTVATTSILFTEDTPMDALWAYPSNTQLLGMFAFGGFVTGLLPQLQAHSFVSVGLIILVTAICQVVSWFISNRNNVDYITKLVIQWTVYGVCAFSIGLPQSFMYFRKVADPGHSFIRYMPIWWDFEPSPNPITLWFHALFLFIPLAFYALHRLRQTTLQKQFQIGFAAVFFMGNFVIFQPWVLDNTKVFYVWVFGASAGIAKLLVWVWEESSKERPIMSRYFERDETWFDRLLLSIPNPMRNSMENIVLKVGCALCVFGLVFSGFLCCYNETLSFNPMYDTKDLELGLWVAVNTPHDANFAVSTHPSSSHMRPVATLGGRQILSSYWGWISNHGMPNHVQRNANNNELLSGSNKARELAMTLNASYIVVDHYHRQDFGLRMINSISYFAAENTKFSLYEVAPYEALVNVLDCLPGSSPTNAELCEAKGCLWIPNSSQEPYCQVPPVWWGLDDIPVKECGYFGIEKVSCEMQGCTWNENFAGPFCQKPIPASSNTVLTNIQANSLGKAECGWSGITPEECELRNCAWSPNERGLPWCQTVASKTIRESTLYRSQPELVERFLRIHSL